MESILPIATGGIICLLALVGTREFLKEVVTATSKPRKV